jgi:hypothetical protein
VSQVSVVGEVIAERAAQDRQWGEQNHPDGTSPAAYTRAAEVAQAVTNMHAAEGSVTWLDILHEEVMEAFASRTPRDELVQVAAVAVAWIEAIDRRKA